MNSRKNDGDKALDGVLRLQDLGMIVNLTVAVVILNIILIVLELFSRSYIDGIKMLQTS